MTGNDFTEMKPRRTHAAGAGAGCVVERLEDRRLLSASVTSTASPAAIVAALAGNLDAAPAAMVLPAVVRAKKLAIKSVPPDCVGAWSGTFRTNLSPTESPLSVTFTKQKVGAVTGTFDLSAMIGAKVLTTASVSKSRSFLAGMKANRSQASFVAVVSPDGKLIHGRWSAIKAGAWVTGTFQMRRG